MKELEEQILNYWGNRAEGYSEYNREELAGEKWPEWIREIKMHLPDREISEIQILDIRPDLDFCYFAGAGRVSGDGYRLYRRNAGRGAA